VKTFVKHGLVCTVLAVGPWVPPHMSSAAVISVTDLTVVAPPPTVGADFLTDQHLPEAVIFDERQNVTLSSALTTDTGVIPTGTLVDSHLFAVQSLFPRALTSSATFSGKVLGVIYLDGSANWVTSDFLGVPGTIYLENPILCQLCGFERTDTAKIIGNTVEFENGFSMPGDIARVITAAAAPLPAAGR
jgi:hypothetical protein